MECYRERSRRGQEQLRREAQAEASGARSSGVGTSDAGASVGGSLTAPPELAPPEAHCDECGTVDTLESIHGRDGAVGPLQPIVSRILMTYLWAAWIPRFDLLRAVSHLATYVRK